MLHFTKNTPIKKTWAKFRKKTLIQAIQIYKPFSVKTKEGTMQGKGKRDSLAPFKHNQRACKKVNTVKL